MSALRSSVGVSGCLFLAATWGCASPPNPPKRAPAPTVVRRTPPPAPSAPSAAPAPPAAPVEIPAITTLEMPAKLSVDGDLSEWRFPEGWDRDRSFHVEIAVGTSLVAISAILGGEAKERGVRLGVRFPAAAFPSAEELRWDGERDGFPCDGDPWPPGVPAAAFKKGCLEDKGRYEKLALAQRLKFEHVYRLGATGLLTADSANEKPVEGATFATKSLGDQVVIEATMPLAALPRTATPTLRAVELFAIPAVGKAPPLEERPWVSEELPVAVPASVYPRLVEQVVTVGADAPDQPSIISWAPGNPNSVEYAFINQYRSAVLLAQLPLFTGGLQLGSVTVVKPAVGPLVTMVGGDFVDATFAMGQPWGLVVNAQKDEIDRDKILSFGATVLHPVKRGDDVFLIEEFTRNWVANAGGVWTEAAWHVSVISPNGKVRQEDAAEPMGTSIAWRQTSLSFQHSADYETLSLEGMTEADYYDSDPKPRTRHSWKYDATQRKYLYKGAERIAPAAAPSPQPSPQKGKSK